MSELDLMALRRHVEDERAGERDMKVTAPGTPERRVAVRRFLEGRREALRLLIQHKATLLAALERIPELEEERDAMQRRAEAAESDWQRAEADLALATERAARLQEALEDIRAALADQEPEGAEATAWVVATRRRAAAGRAVVARESGEDGSKR